MARIYGLQTNRYCAYTGNIESGFTYINCKTLLHLVCLMDPNIVRSDA